jgi:hypothetical protein
VEGKEVLVSVPLENQPPEVVQFFGLDAARDARINAQ